MKARKIELKTLEVEGQKPLLYADLLHFVITSSGPGGLSTDEVLKADDVDDETALRPTAAAEDEDEDLEEAPIPVPAKKPTVVKKLVKPAAKK